MLTCCDNCDNVTACTLWPRKANLLPEGIMCAMRSVILVAVSRWGMHKMILLHLWPSRFSGKDSAIFYHHLYQHPHIFWFLKSSSLSLIISISKIVGMIHTCYDAQVIESEQSSPRKTVLTTFHPGQEVSTFHLFNFSSRTRGFRAD